MKKLLLTLCFTLIGAPSFAQDQKISDLSSGSPVQATDMIPIARAGANFRLAGSDFLSSAGGATGCTNPPFSFTDDTTAGVCLTGADSVILQTGAATGRLQIIGASAGFLGLTWVYFGSSDRDPLDITTVAAGAGSFHGAFTSVDLTAAQTWTFPNATGDVAVIASTGFPVRTGAQAWAARTITAGTGISIANGAGTAGNPTVSIDTATTPQFSSGTGDVPATGGIGTWYTETDTNNVYTYPSTDTETWLLSLAAGGGTSGGIPYFSNATDGLASSGLLTANLPVIGGGAGAAPAVGTRSGNTTAYVTTTGTQTSGDCVKIDASGNHIANGSACGGGSLDITGLTAEPLVNMDDYFPFYDTSATANRKIERSQLTNVGRAFWVLENDFMAYGSAAIPAPFRISLNGDASDAYQTSEASHPGILRLSTGTGATNFAAVASDAAESVGVLSVLSTGGRIHFTTWVRITTLSDGTETYAFAAGLNDCVYGGGCTPTDAIVITYTNSVNSGKWRGVCTEDSASTNVDDTGTAVAAATWYRLEFEINAAATSVEFFVNGTSIGSCGSNVADASDPLGPNVRFLKSAGTTARTFDLDAIKFYGELDTAR
jgi:hypothetical protein